MTTRGKHTCLSCGSENLKRFFETPPLPVHCVQLQRSQIQAGSLQKAKLNLAFCEKCGFVQNQAFDSDLLDYAKDYEETQAYSRHFVNYMDELIQNLDERHDLRDKKVLEVGCGKGEFLQRLCEKTGCVGVGFDPSYLSGREQSGGPASVTFESRNLTRKDTQYIQEADLIICRHTLEHIRDVQDFLSIFEVGAISEKDTSFFIEVPDLERILSEHAFWDLNYEHCSYFTSASLIQCLRKANWTVQRIRKVYDGQYLMAEGVIGKKEGMREENPEELFNISQLVNEFQKQISLKISFWQKKLSHWNDHGTSVAIWGASSKTVAFLGHLGDSKGVSAVVDINPNKWNFYLPGSGLLVQNPSELVQVKPEKILVMNPIYLDEISGHLNELGVKSELIAL